MAANKQHIDSPKASPAARWSGIVLGVALIALAVVFGREIWVHESSQNAQPWVGYVLDHIAQAQYHNWMLAAGIIGIIVGLIFLVVSLKPRRQTHQGLALEGVRSAWVRNVDVARLATATAERVPGVYKATTYATPRAITLTLEGDRSDETLVQRTSAAVTQALHGLVNNPNVKVKIHEWKGEA